MGETIVEYLRKERSSFLDKSLNCVDSIVLSTAAYFKFELGAIGRTVPSERIPLPVALCGVRRRELIGRTWLSHEDGDGFLQALLESPRFMDLEAGYYVNDVSDHFEKQFSAITFFLPDDSAYVAFRGTDNTLAGWKEDFNLSYLEQIPSQRSGLVYLEDMADIVTGGLFVGGHSKGGNIAEFAALTCRERTFDRVERVFNHDGPGFAHAPSERISQPAYLAKLDKTIPEDSIVGMLTENRTCLRVVKSSGRLSAQHAITRWEHSGGDLVTADEISAEAKIISGALTNWAKSYSAGQIERFLDLAFEILRATDATTLSEMRETPAATALAVVETAAQLPPEMRSVLFDTFSDLGPLIGSEAAKIFLNAASSIVPLPRAQRSTQAES